MASLMVGGQGEPSGRRTGMVGNGQGSHIKGETTTGIGRKLWEWREEMSLGNTVREERIELGD